MLSFLKSREGDSQKSMGKSWLILAAAAVGVLLILLGGSFDGQEQKTADLIYKPEEDELVLYQQYLEERVKSLCESVGGVGKVTAIVTLSGGFESVYATEWKNGEEEYVIIGSGSGASALFLSRDAPPIAGIGIVCRGGNDANIRQELTALISAAFHVSTNRIYITAPQ